MFRTLFVLFAMVSFSSPSLALFDDFDELEGQTVVEAGDLKKINCPIGGDYNCLTWPMSFFKLNAICVEAVGGFASGYSLRGLLTVDRNGTPSLFILSGLVSSDVKRYGATIYDCPMGVY